MAKREYGVDLVKVKYYCDNCGHELDYVGNVYPGSPKKYQHNCPDCGKRYRLEKVYPTLEHRVKEDIPHRIDDCEEESTEG